MREKGFFLVRIPQKMRVSKEPDFLQVLFTPQLARPFVQERKTSLGIVVGDNATTLRCWDLMGCLLFLHFAIWVLTTSPHYAPLYAIPFRPIGMFATTDGHYLWCRWIPW